jgi:hypothetical protein
MTRLRTTDDVLAGLRPPRVARLPAPPYAGTSSAGVGLAVEAMQSHTSDEGWQAFEGLQAAGYELAGFRLTTWAEAPAGGLRAREGMTHVPDILEFARPGVVVVQDKREYEGMTADHSLDPRARFTGVEALAGRPDVFRLTVLKDAHQRPDYHRAAAAEIGAHAHVCYYHPRVVAWLAPYVRLPHLVRT